MHVRTVYAALRQPQYGNSSNSNGALTNQQRSIHESFVQLSRDCPDPEVILRTVAHEQQPRFI